MRELLGPAASIAYGSLTHLSRSDHHGCCNIRRRRDRQHTVRMEQLDRYHRYGPGHFLPRNERFGSHRKSTFSMVVRAVRNIHRVPDHVLRETARHDRRSLCGSAADRRRRWLDQGRLHVCILQHGRHPRYSLHCKAQHQLQDSRCRGLIRSYQCLQGIIHNSSDVRILSAINDETLPIAT